MNRLTSLKYAAAVLPVLAMGVPVVNAQSEKYEEARDQHTAARALTATEDEFLEFMPANGFHVDSLIGQVVRSRDSDEAIGEINNLLMDENGQIVAVVLSMGGALGIGEHDVAIAWNQIERRVDGDQIKLLVSQAEQSLKDAPEYSGEVEHSSKARYTSREQYPAGERMDDDRPNQLETASVRSSANDSGASKADAEDMAPDRFLATLPVRGYHSDNLIGQEVLDRNNNQSIGEVSDLVLNENGQVIALIVSVGGILGLGERNVAISWDQVQRHSDGEKVTLSVDFDEASLNDAPKYTRGHEDSRR